ncbi:hypothetical protein [Noviherbaspirillum saxi]|uniref:hypothetical protein n=1 Tax=Noviherbaspirillum saxi TaxID=2320863 RepID=UPI0013147374|nr:hypothetical protein [Noviherbaspirillum saxi]
MRTQRDFGARSSHFPSSSGLLSAKAMYAVNTVFFADVTRISECVDTMTLQPYR